MKLKITRDRRFCCGGGGEKMKRGDKCTYIFLDMRVYLNLSEVKVSDSEVDGGKEKRSQFDQCIHRFNYWSN